MFVYGSFWNGFQWWWIIPVGMMILCFLLMRGRGGCMIGGRRSGNLPGGNPVSPSDTARDILDKRYALGEISRAEYEEKKRDLGMI